MPAQFTVIAGPDRGRVFQVIEAESSLIGRSRHTAIRLTDMRVSRVHCEVELEGRNGYVTDLESVGGTFVNGKPITEQSLHPGDILQVGDTQLRMGGEDVSDKPTLPPAAAVAAKPPLLTRERLRELTGRTLSHFQIGPVIAPAQTGMVFQARDFKDGRVVAFKVLWPDAARKPEEMRRFIRAVKTMLPVRHPNLVTLFGAGKMGPYCWIAMEYVKGESLAQVIQRIGTAGMLDWRHAFRVAVHIARGLEFAHQQHIIHRNITPTNILVRGSDQLTKLGDLMLAKALEGGLAEQITRAGELLGDLRDMPPERARGNVKAVDPRSDLYSLGAVLYALLTGRPPFEGPSTLDTLQLICRAEPVKPRKYQLAIPDLMEGIVLRLLAKRPDDRYATAKDLLRDLLRLGTRQQVAVDPDAP